MNAVLAGPVGVIRVVFAMSAVSPLYPQRTKSLRDSPLRG